jgi:hypothetical protein
MVPYDQVFSVFALYEGKNRKQEKEKYRSAARPEPAEGKAKKRRLRKSCQ